MVARRHIRVLRLYALGSMENRTRNAIWFLIKLINPLVTLLFWQGAYAKQAHILNWSQSQMTTYYLCLVVVQSALVANIESVVAHHDIKNGFLSSELLKPISYLWRKFCQEIPSRLLQATYGVIAILFVVYFVQVKPVFRTDGLTILEFLVIAAGGFVISFLIKMCVGFVAFWTTDIAAVQEVVDVAILILTGILMPLDLYPATISYVMLHSPFAYVVYHPIVHIVHGQGGEFLLIVAGQVVWIGILYVIYVYLWRKGIIQFTGMGQ